MDDAHKKLLLKFADSVRELGPIAGSAAMLRASWGRDRNLASEERKKIRGMGLSVLKMAFSNMAAVPFILTPNQIEHPSPRSERMRLRAAESVLVCLETSRTGSDIAKDLPAGLRSEETIAYLDGHQFPLMANMVKQAISQQPLPA